MLVQVGCLTVGLTKHDRSIACSADVTESGMTVKAAVRDAADVRLTPHRTTLSAALNAVHQRPAVKTVGRNVKTAVTAALVCMVHGHYELFYVDDEPLVVTDGYFMVRKKS